MNRSKEFCRFCLKGINDSCHEKLEKSLRNILNALNIKVNLDITEKLTLCANCVERLQKLYIFKIVCAETENRLIPFISLQSGKKIDLPQVYLQLNKNGSLGDKNVCRFCLCEVANEFSKQSGSVTEVMPAMRNLLDTFFPKMDINLVKDPIICKMCQNLLQDYLTFTKNCENVEENIQTYIEVEEISDEGKIDLKKLRQFLDTTVIKKEVGRVNGVKQEIWPNDEYMEDPSSPVHIKRKNVRQAENLQLGIKSESIGLKVVENNSKSKLNIASADKGINNQRQDSSDKCGKENCLYETEYSGLHGRKLKHKDRSKVTMYRCRTEGCLFQTKYPSSLRKHALVHKDVSEVKMYKCEHTNCTFETKHKNRVKSHMLTHKIRSGPPPIYKCDFKGCSYETEYTVSLGKHKLIHIDRSDVTTYKCKEKYCSYETICEKNLAQHQTVHKVTVYRCVYENCWYETKYKWKLKPHMLVHKKPDPLAYGGTGRYKCDIENCAFETRNKRSLDKHKLDHNDATGRKVYKCEVKNCFFSTKRKCSFTLHKSIHKDPSEGKVCKYEDGNSPPGNLQIKLFQCGYEGCTYKTKQKHHLQRHIFSAHKTASKVSTYNCDVKGCSYETKHKGNLGNHILLHKDPSKSKHYKCLKVVLIKL